jgi:hypothetical protein
MNFTAETGSSATIHTYIPSFVRTGSTFQQLTSGIHRCHVHRINMPLFFKTRKLVCNIVSHFAVARTALRLPKYIRNKAFRFAGYINLSNVWHGSDENKQWGALAELLRTYEARCDKEHC